MIERFLDQLASEAGKTRPPHEVAELVAEVREHLEDSIQARVELGRLPEDATKEALSSFGDARAVASAEARRRETTRNVARLRWLGAFYAALALYSGVVLARFDVGILSFAPFGLLLGFACASFRARRPAPVPVVVGGLLITITLASLMVITTGQERSVGARLSDLLIYPTYTGALDLFSSGLGAFVFAVRRRLRKDRG